MCSAPGLFHGDETMNNKGYISISRSVLSWPLWGNAYSCALLFYCLLKATHKDYGDLHAGQFRQSQQEIASELDWSRTTVHKYLHALEIEGLIMLSGDEANTLITVIDWSTVYGTDSQGTDSEAESPVCEMVRPVREMVRSCTRYGMTCTRNGTHTTRTEQENENETDRVREFESWWAEYPRHSRKSEARNAWIRLEVPAEKLFSALRNAKQTPGWIKENGRYIPAAVNFLDGCWEDFIDDDEMEASQVWTEY